MAVAERGGRDPEGKVPAAHRKELLLDAAYEIVLEGGPAAVSMGTVAARGKVARGLVYRHFDNRDEILKALYHRESAKVDRLIRVEIASAPDGFEAKFRAYVSSVVTHVNNVGPVVRQLQAASVDNGFDNTQNEWDRRTVQYFGGLASEWLDIDPGRARLAVSLILGGMSQLLTQTRMGSRTEPATVEALYIDLSLAALGALRGS